MRGRLPQALRDLQWLVSCPYLVDDSPGGVLMRFPPPVSLPDEQEAWEPIKRHFESRAANRVGYYAEALMQMWLSGIAGVSGIEHGIVIKDGKVTLGELDFLFRHEGRLHHLEVALKFFLYRSVTDGETSVTSSQFPGPNAADNFEKKRDKLLQQQLPLGRKQFPEISESHSFVKGMIFFRPGEPRPALLPERMNPHHLSGTWIRSNELDWLLDGVPQNSRGLVMKKPFWLSGLRGPCGSVPPGLTLGNLHAAVTEQFRQRESPVLLSLAKEGDSGWQEEERVFVVSEDWPGNATLS